MQPKITKIILNRIISGLNLDLAQTLVKERCEYKNQKKVIIKIPILPDVFNFFFYKMLRHLSIWAIWALKLPLYIA